MILRMRYSHQVPSAVVQVWRDKEYKTYARKNTTFDYCDSTRMSRYHVDVPGGWNISDIRCSNPDSAVLVSMAPQEVSVTGSILV